VAHYLFRVPTRLIYGVTDVLVPPQHGEWLARDVPGAEAVIEEGAISRALIL
jgi:pimeloyl-ACP methyl ester carboxylesterase